MNPACAQRKKFRVPHVNLVNSYLLFDKESNKYNVLLKNNSGDVS